ncbi:MAG TPA: hypothetical protein DDX98_09185 [Bacteroidales bacterium]|jgi:predicted dienelactone hydrolase|nr:hypothetical protein [Bacteroidales bacterium]
MKHAYLLILIFGSIAVYSQVGLKQITFTDSSRSRNLKSTIFYPTKSELVQEYGGNRVFMGFMASKDTEISTHSKLPLIILAHGTSGNWRNLSWLADTLVKKGAIAVAANHPGSTTGDATPASVFRTWNQPLDISFLIDRMLASEFSQHIDTGKIIVIGSSLGGYTALALSGAKVKLEKYPDFCEKHSDEACNYFWPVFESLDQDFFEKTNQLYIDSRIKLSIALVPGFVEVMTRESLQNMDNPILIVGAEMDENLPPETHFLPYLDNLSATAKYHTVEGANHYSFLQQCKSGALEILAEEEAEFVCIEKGDRKREEIHEEVIEMVISFIESHIHASK